MKARVCLAIAVGLLLSGFVVPVLAEDAVAMWVSQARLAYVGRSSTGDDQVVALVHIRDANQKSVANAQVFVEWILPGGASLRESAWTNVQGIASFELWEGGGTYWFSVQNVEKSNRFYDPSQNRMTSVSIVVASPPIAAPNPRGNGPGPDQGESTLATLTAPDIIAATSTDVAVATVDASAYETYAEDAPAEALPAYAGQVAGGDGNIWSPNQAPAYTAAPIVVEPVYDATANAYTYDYAYGYAYEYAYEYAYQYAYDYAYHYAYDYADIYGNQVGNAYDNSYTNTYDGYDSFNHANNYSNAYTNTYGPQASPGFAYGP